MTEVSRPDNDDNDDNNNITKVIKMEKIDNSYRNIITVFSQVTTPTFPTQYCAGDKIEKNEMGGACSADGGGEGPVKGFGGET
jgi:hypothetical protein